MRSSSAPYCPVCRELMRFARSQAHSLSTLQTFECCRCGLALTGEAVVEALELGQTIATQQELRHTKATSPMGNDSYSVLQANIVCLLLFLIATTAVVQHPSWFQ